MAFEPSRKRSLTRVVVPLVHLSIAQAHRGDIHEGNIVAKHFTVWLTFHASEAHHTVLDDRRCGTPRQLPFSGLLFPLLELTVLGFFVAVLVVVVVVTQ